MFHRLKHKTIARAMVFATTCAVVLTTAQPTQAKTSEASAERTVTSAEAASNALKTLGLQESGPVEFDVNKKGSTAEAGEVTTADRAVQLPLGGNTDLAVQMPIGADTTASTTDSGGVLLQGEQDGLDVVLQPVGEESARIMTVAGAEYGSAQEHEYAYDLGLPQGATLEVTPEGGLVVVQDIKTATDIAEPLAPAELSKILPDPALVDEAEYEAGLEATQEGNGGAAAFEPDNGQTILASFTSPWSVDANGNELPTHYSVDGSIVVQHVDVSDAAFPVVSDPLPLIGIALGAAARALAPAAIRAFAGTTIRAGMAYTVRGGYSTFAKFKAAYGTKSGYQWHHVVV
ncbi:hypothetical protein GCM10027456_70300 [Kineosporia babensis]